MRSRLTTIRRLALVKELPFPLMVRALCSCERHGDNGELLCGCGDPDRHRPGPDNVPNNVAVIDTVDGNVNPSHNHGGMDPEHCSPQFSPDPPTSVDGGRALGGPNLSWIVVLDKDESVGAVVGAGLVWVPAPQGP